MTTGQSASTYRVAIVVPSRDRPEMLATSLGAVKAALRPDDEALVVDSASRSPDTAEVATRAGIRVVRCSLPGASRARNLGLTVTTSPLVFFTDDDCLVHPGLPAAVERAFSDPNLGFVSGTVIGDRDHGPSVSTMLSQTPLGFAGAQDPHDMGHGASMAFRREALRAVGGFDERLGAGARLRGSEEKDVFWRLLRAGWTGRYDPQVVVTHRQWRSRARVVATNLGYGMGTGALAAKIARTDGRLGWQILLDRIWGQGVRTAFRAVRARHEQGVLDSLAATVGVIVGAVRGAFLPIREGRFKS